ncbi:MAG: hypothetical protein DCE86_01015 [Flavobacteriaceae bacterium]|nr:hypothetical protein ASG38_07260 [Flavobacterium sp. Leaf359]PZO34746.1 MAG: hypothetical protein DCE86_01015 [Flavobacteriaceae bacterium]PZQ86258.1 MAG: hypothetical protein DI548_07505 [Flavobacterium johnsoniae]
MELPTKKLFTNITPSDMKNSITTKISSLLLLLFLSTASFAQDPTEAPEDEDVTPAPINDYIVPMLLAGVVLGYTFIKGKAKKA